MVSALLWICRPTRLGTPWDSNDEADGRLDAPNCKNIVYSHATALGEYLAGTIIGAFEPCIFPMAPDALEIKQIPEPRSQSPSKIRLEFLGRFWPRWR